MKLHRASTRIAVLLAVTFAVTGPSGVHPRQARAEPPCAVVDGAPFTAVIVDQVPPATPRNVGAHESGGPFAGPLPSGSRIVVVDLMTNDASVRHLTEGFDAAGRADLSFDAKHILFVGRRTSSEPLSVWELTLATSHLRQVTQQPGDCFGAIYLSTYFSMQTGEPVPLICFSALVDGSVALFTCQPDGTHVRRITFHPMDTEHPRLLDDGRLLFSVPRPSTNLHVRCPPGDSERGDRVQMTIHVDGADVCGFTGAAAVGADSLNGPVLGMPLPAVVTSDRSRSIDPRHESRVRQLLDADRWDEANLLPVASRRQPPGRSSAIDDRQECGQIYCLNAYLMGKRVIGPAEGTRISAVRVIRGTRRADAESGDRSAGPCRFPLVETALAEVPVEADGSFFMTVPARTAIRLETLNAEGRVLNAMKSWMCVMPNEVRGCIGCHEDRTLAPPNRLVLAWRKLPHRVSVAPDDHAHLPDRMQTMDSTTPERKP
ncbi:MAG: hypothetical protein HUU22_09445 [Phycisphaerae bacterium]|nr:hypothetical protein [Phycisphaerae bacterium]